MLAFGPHRLPRNRPPASALHIRSGPSVIVEEAVWLDLNRSTVTLRITGNAISAVPPGEHTP
jgi:hypothetical protein